MQQELCTIKVEIHGRKAYENLQKKHRKIYHLASECFISNCNYIRIINIFGNKPIKIYEKCSGTTIRPFKSLVFAQSSIEVSDENGSKAGDCKYRGPKEDETNKVKCQTVLMSLSSKKL